MKRFGPWPQVIFNNCSSNNSQLGGLDNGRRNTLNVQLCGAASVFSVGGQNNRHIWNKWPHHDSMATSNMKLFQLRRFSCKKKNPRAWNPFVLLAIVVQCKPWALAGASMCSVFRNHAAAKYEGCVTALWIHILMHFNVIGPEQTTLRWLCS